MSGIRPVDPLAQRIADVREEATVLRANHAAFSVDRVLEILAGVEADAEEWMTWLSEGDAAVRAGRSVEWMRAQFDRMQRDRHARLNGRARQYRACAVPRRANTTSAAAQGRAAAQALRQSA